MKAKRVMTKAEKAECRALRWARRRYPTLGLITDLNSDEAPRKGGYLLTWEWANDIFCVRVGDGHKAFGHTPKEAYLNLLATYHSGMPAEVVPARTFGHQMFDPAGNEEMCG